MTRPLLVGVAHGLDLLTFLLAVAAFGIRGESNGLLRGWALLPAAAAGIVGAVTNLLALGLR
jgi:hypothetical protein